MKTYKDYPREYIGTSDIARLTVVDAGGCYNLKFGGDNVYYAYIIEQGRNEFIPVPDRYELRMTIHSPWLKIYDDSGLAYELKDIGSAAIYRAGSYGCIIRVVR